MGQTEEMNSGAVRAKSDPAYRNSFIDDNSGFIMSCAYKAVGHFITKSDDEWSIALIAFNEAIDSFEEGKGSFSSLAGLVIRRRLTDHLRSQYRHSVEIPVDRSKIDGDPEEEDEVSGISLEVKKREAQISEEKSLDPGGAVSIKDEIDALCGALKKYGFTFFDLTECSPRAEKTRMACAQAVRYLIGDGEILAEMRRTGLLPIAVITKNTGIPRKILERHRKYIIAAGEILGGDYPQLSEYLKYIRDDRVKTPSGVSPVMLSVLSCFVRILNI